ncbi:MAG: HEAT repeat domain-containing protein [Ignavibacteriae bacterium]|nr:HEAT repeat domain-containing protein [Ignavibacteriota bacterium]MCB9210527.1 HEAT repeat domain-containing protein [Ignavibacteriales bacterium]MCB9219858.1 HEAT repeat domain-containing protein [Ignavibacteriales bacterium]MCB9257733.1 HEAT repeat domain-containing protein [Ignavibacteriales bacterium]
MKFRTLINWFIISIFLSTSIFAGVKDLEKYYNRIEENLIVGVESDNQGLRISAAYFLGEINSEKAVIPLMKMLKSSPIEEERLIAALSLAKIKSEKGIYAIKQRIKFDESERVQRLCTIFYNNHKLENIRGDVIVEPFDLADLNLEYKGIKLQQFLN